MQDCRGHVKDLPSCSKDSWHSLVNPFVMTLLSVITKANLFLKNRRKIMSLQVELNDLSQLLMITKTTKKRMRFFTWCVLRGNMLIFGGRGCYYMPGGNAFPETETEAYRLVKPKTEKKENKWQMSTITKAAIHLPSARQCVTATLPLCLCEEGQPGIAHKERSASPC